VKAHHFRLELFDDGAHRGIEGKPVRHRDRRCRVDAQFNVIRFEFFPPRILALIVGNRHFVREEVQIDRLTSGGLAKLCHLGPHLICAKHAGRQGAEPAAATAIASSESIAPAIGANKMRCSIRKRSSKRRSGHMGMIPARD
jgi:hypothetical protein